MEREEFEGLLNMLFMVGREETGAASFVEALTVIDTKVNLLAEFDCKTAEIEALNSEIDVLRGQLMELLGIRKVENEPL